MGLQAFLLILLGVLVTAILLVVFKITRALITKPNLRYYLIATLKDVKHMYNRYHV